MFERRGIIGQEESGKTCLSSFRMTKCQLKGFGGSREKAKTTDLRLFLKKGGSGKRSRPFSAGS